jgi:hypothetical protein
MWLNRAVELLVVGCVASLAAGLRAAEEEPNRGPMSRVRVSDDCRGFVLADSGRPFTPWGVNYGHGGQLLEDFWETDWKSIESDFQEMKALGVNVARVHLQLGKFMATPDTANEAALDRLQQLLKLAEETGIYLDITGLGCYRPADVPAWYDGLSEQERWAVQSRFWEAVAERCAKSSAVFCYCLMNEPLSPGGQREPGQWYSGKLLGGFDFLQFISLDQAGRPREEIARQWIKTLTTAIRKHDRRTMITVGLLPWSKQWRHLSGFLPEKVAPELDFVSVHVYPQSGKVDEALEGLKKFAVGKPLVVEETFPLACGAEDLEDFLKQSREVACGWIGHYDGRSKAELLAAKERGTLSIGDALWLEWLKLFERLGPTMQQPLPRE